MGQIKILKKYSCNTISLVTNKGEKPEVIKLNIDKVAINYPELGIVVLRPSIDRLVFGFSPAEELLKKYDPSIELDEYCSCISKSFAGDGFDTNITGLSFLKGVSFKKPPYSNYNVNLSFKPCAKSEPVIIQVGPKKGGHSFIRFDMNPNRITEFGMKTFWALLQDNLMLPSGAISHEDILIWSKVYSLEIAVDILGCRPSDMEILPMTNSKVTPQKSHIYKSKTGRIQTKYPKIKAGKNHSEYVYDKRQEMIDRGQAPYYGECLHSRFECRVGKTTFYKLKALKNRCVRISAKALNYQKLHKMDWVHHMFLRHSLERTVEKSLEIVPAKEKVQFNAVYNESFNNIWDAKTIWSYWPNVLKQSGLFPN